MRQKRLLLLLVLLLTATTGAWAQDAKHLITATYDKQTRLLEQPLPYATTVGELYEAVTGEPFSDLLKTMSAVEMPLTGISSNTPGVVSIGDFNGASTPVTVKADGKATVSLSFSGIYQGIYVSVVPPLYVTMADGTKDAAKWTATVGTNSNAKTLPVGELSKGNAVTLTYGGRLKVKNVTATTDAELVTLATPLTTEAITPGTILVNTNGTLSTGMKYSVNGRTKTDITSTTTIEGLKAGDKVQFYSNGTGNTVYSNVPEVNISGGTAEVKVYGNIMSLLDEEGFATKTNLENYVFFGLFHGNSTLIDASELLLPAETLTPGCYQQMFQGCTALTKAPKLPATWLETYCYYAMFYGCESLTSAYVKAAYTEVTAECDSMFDGCTADDAVLHTTSGNKASWEGVMGTGNWTVADDWQD